MWYFSKKEKENRYPLDQKKSSLLWFIIFVFYYFDFRETGSIILATNRIFYSLGPNEYSVLYLFYSKICQRMSENWKRF